MNPGCSEFGGKRSLPVGSESYVVLVQKKSCTFSNRNGWHIGHLSFERV